MFLRNYWYVAAFSDEVREERLGRTILNEPVALFRTKSGAVAALEDRCSHRWMPLSKGWVDGEMLVCCYHGVAFDSAGACVRVPGRDTPQPGLAVRRFPTVERYGAIWIWMGDPQLADPAKILDCKLMDPGGQKRQPRLSACQRELHVHQRQSLRSAPRRFPAQLRAQEFIEHRQHPDGERQARCRPARRQRDRQLDLDRCSHPADLAPPRQPRRPRRR